jgi:shikimate kinase
MFDGNIYLTGFMGAGKSTTGKALANLLKYRFVDLDTEIVKQQGRSIAEIFSAEGEKYFRDLETCMLNSLESSDLMVCATGGGIVERDQNRLKMRQSGLIIYLSAQWSTLKMRLESSQGRPLVDPGKNWDEVKRKWDARQKYYRDADFIVDTDNLNPSQVAVQINEILNPDYS